MIAGLFAAALGVGCVHTNPAERPTTGKIRVEGNSIIIPPAQPILLIKAGMTREQVEELLDERSPADFAPGLGQICSSYRKTFDGYVYYDANDRVIDTMPRSALKRPGGYVPD